MSVQIDFVDMENIYGTVFIYFVQLIYDVIRMNANGNNSVL